MQTHQNDTMPVKLTLEFCGIKPVKVSNIGPLKLSKEAYRKKWLDKVEAMGRKSL
jgi:NAD(P)H dehydrogenase (quinone)